MRSAFSFQEDSLHLPCLDESSHSHDPSSDFFVLAGFSIFERQTHWLEAQIDPIAARFSSTSQGFGVEILYPGLALTSDDSAIGPIGRIDRAEVQPGHLLGMHPHRNDEILTYVRGGEMLHRDTVGSEAKLDKTHFMMMIAGHTFQHEN